MVRITVPTVDAAQSRNKTLVPFCVPAWFVPHLISYAETLSAVPFFTGTDEQQIDAMYDTEDALVAMMLPESCQDVVTYNPCGTEYLPNSEFISWAPNDPFLSPDHKPTGYAHPPWVQPSAAIPGTELIGIEETDVITTFLQITGNLGPINWLDLVKGFIFHGFPRFTIHVHGAGTVELHLIKVPLGGLALVNVDHSLSNNKLVELATYEVTDIDSYLSQFAQILQKGLAGALFVEEIIEVEIEDDGDHDINVTMLPQISSDTLLGFGGGLRSVNFCGSTGGQDVPLDIDVRLNGVDLEWRKSPTSAWINLGRVRGYDGINGICEPCPDNDIGYSEPSNPAYYVRAARVIAEGVWNDLYRSYTISTPDTEYDAQSLESSLPSTLRVYPHYTASIGDESINYGTIINWWLDIHTDAPKKAGIINNAACKLLDMFENNPLGFSAGYTNPASSKWADYVNTAGLLGTSGDLTPEQNHLLAESLILQLAYYAAGHPARYLQAVYYEANLSSLTGAEIANCDAVYSVWCRQFDFTESSLGWVPIVGTYGGALGFGDEITQAGADYRRSVTISLPLAGESEIGEVGFVYDAEFDGGDEYIEIEVLLDGVGVDSIVDDMPSDGESVEFGHDFEGLVGDEIRITLVSGVQTGSAPDGSVVITSASASGEGITPSQGENCADCGQIDFSGTVGYAIIEGTRESAGGNPSWNLQDNQQTSSPWQAEVVLQIDTSGCGEISQVSYDMYIHSGASTDRDHIQRVRTSVNGIDWVIAYDSSESLAEEIWYTRSRAFTAGEYAKIEIKLLAGWSSNQSGVVRLDNISVQ